MPNRPRNGTSPSTWGFFLPVSGFCAHEYLRLKFRSSSLVINNKQNPKHIIYHSLRMMIQIWEQLPSASNWLLNPYVTPHSHSSSNSSFDSSSRSKPQPSPAYRPTCLPRTSFVCFPPPWFHLRFVFFHMSKILTWWTLGMGFRLYRSKSIFRKKFYCCKTSFGGSCKQRRIGAV